MRRLQAGLQALPEVWCAGWCCAWASSARETLRGAWGAPHQQPFGQHFVLEKAERFQNWLLALLKFPFSKVNEWILSSLPQTHSHRSLRTAWLRSLAPQTGENSTTCPWEQQLSTEPGLGGTASPRKSLQKGINAEGGCALNRRNIAE